MPTGEEDEAAEGLVRRGGAKDDDDVPEDEGLEEGSEEMDLLREMREVLEREIAQAAQYSDVVGDLRILRTLRKHDLNFELATEEYRTYLSMRYKHGMDDIRKHIEEHYVNGSPYNIRSLPHGEEAAEYLNWDFDAGSTPQGDIVHYYGRHWDYEKYTNAGLDSDACIKNMGQEKMELFMKGVFEMSSMQLQERSTEEGEACKIVVIVDLRDFRNRTTMYKWYHWEIMPLCEAMLPDSVRAIYLLNVPQHMGKDVCEEAMHHLGIGIPQFNDVECWVEDENFLRNERLLSDLDLGVLSKAIVPSLKGLSTARGLTRVHKWDWCVRVIEVQKGQEISWDCLIQKSLMRDATVEFSAHLYMSPGDKEGIYCQCIVENKMFAEQDGMLCGEFLVKDDGIFVLRYSNYHSWIRDKWVRYNVDDRMTGNEADRGTSAPTIDEVEMFPMGAESDAESDVGLD